MHAPAAPRIGAAALALVLVYVDPTLVESAPHRAHVLLAKRRHRFEHQLFGRLVAERAFDLLRKGSVQVPRLHAFHAEGFFLQRHVFVQRRQFSVHRRDQAVVDGHGDLVAVQRSFQRRSIAAQAREGGVFLDAGRIGRAQRVAELRKRPVNALERFAAHAAIRRRDVAAVTFLRQRPLFALFVGDLAELHVRVGEHGKDLVGRPGQLAHRRHDGFLFGGKDVFFLEQDAPQHQAVQFQFRLLRQKGLDFRLVGGEDLRRQERRRLGRPNAQLRGARRQRLRPFRRRVLVAAHHRVTVQPPQQIIQTLVQRDRLQQRRGRIHHAPPAGRQFRRRRFRFLRLRFPLRRRGVNVFQLPARRLGHLRARFVQRRRVARVAGDARCLRFVLRHFATPFLIFSDVQKPGMKNSLRSCRLMR